jgi:hypothetical protein
MSWTLQLAALITMNTGVIEETNVIHLRAADASTENKTRSIVMLIDLETAPDLLHG